MWIVDRATGVKVRAAVASYHMFGETWYTRDYDVPGCPIRPADTVIDIGANQGFFSCYAASKGAFVHAFEPFAESVARLRGNIDRNGFHDLVHVSEVAVSTSDGLATLHCSPTLGGGVNSLLADHAHQFVDGGTIEVETRTIDSILDQLDGSVRLCKLDCEGSELEILNSLSTPENIESFAIEFHTAAYSLTDLVATLLNWKSHQVTFGREGSCLIYAVRSDVLSEYAGSCH